MRGYHSCLLQSAHAGEGADGEEVKRLRRPLKNEEKGESGKLKDTSHTSTYHPTLTFLHFILHEHVMHAEDKHSASLHATAMDCCLRMP